MTNNVSQLNEIITEINKLSSNVQFEQDKHMTVLSEIISRIDKLEKTYVSINADLINQNIKMS